MATDPEVLHRESYNSSPLMDDPILFQASYQSSFNEGRFDRSLRESIDLTSEWFRREDQIDDKIFKKVNDMIRYNRREG